MSEYRPRLIKSKVGIKFIHPCVVCGEWGDFGVDVNLTKALEEHKAEHAGTWYCWEHWPGRKRDAA